MKSGNAGKVGQQLMDGDGIPGRRDLGNIFRDRIGDLKQSFLFQLQDAEGREHLGDRANAKHRLRRVGRVEFVIGHPIALAQDDLVALGKKHRSGESPLLCPSGKVLVGPGGSVLARGVES